MRIKILSASSPEELMSITNSWLERESKVKTIAGIQYSTCPKPKAQDNYYNIKYSVCIYYEE